MEFPQPLERGVLVRRYKRFLADIVLDRHGPATAHVANPGAMLGLAEEGATVWASPAVAPGRKLAWSLELVETAAGALVGVNTQLANVLAAEAIAADQVPELAGYASMRREVRVEDGRLDLLLEGGARPRCWVEVKSVTLSRKPGLAEWPDCVSARSSRQLAGLERLVAAGDRAVLLFVVQRADCDRFNPAADLDPTFAAALRLAADRGVGVACHAAAVTLSGLRIERSLPLA
jgi:sugar fermentation stimulation protein A